MFLIVLDGVQGNGGGIRATSVNWWPHSLRGSGTLGGNPARATTPAARRKAGQSAVERTVQHASRCHGCVLPDALGVGESPPLKCRAAGASSSGRRPGPRVSSGGGGWVQRGMSARGSRARSVEIFLRPVHSAPSDSCHPPPRQYRRNTPPSPILPLPGVRSAYARLPRDDDPTTH